MLLIEMEEANLEIEKPGALFVCTKFEMPLRSPCGDVEQAMGYRDWSSGERSVISRLKNVKFQSYQYVDEIERGGIG